MPRLLLAAVMIGAVAKRAGAANVSLLPRVTTNKGCLETGDAATFAVGERIIIFLSVGSSTFSHVNATLFSIKPHGFVSVFGLGAIFTNVTYGFSARVGIPAGPHELQFKASAGGLTSTHSCTFDVGKATTKTPNPTTATKTPTRTKTPTPTKTPTGGAPSAKLQPHVTTSRGCEETGQDPTFVVGESIFVSYGIDSSVFSVATATLFDILPGGFVNVLRNRLVLTNQTFSFKATVSPPTGVEVLRLRASAFGVPSVSSFCTFTVVHPPAKTRTATRTRTSTPTPTPTPTPP